jgi:hypothetical protein
MSTITIEIFHVAFERAPQHVATLRSTIPLDCALEDAFSGTQNVKSFWVTSRGQNGVRIEPTPEIERMNGCRSTSVGDYARVIEDGRESFWRCCPSGWKPIESREGIALVGAAARLAACDML